MQASQLNSQVIYILFGASAPTYIKQVAATRQHVGKTTTSLALMSGLQKRLKRVGFVKPVGQQSLNVFDELTGQHVQVDKDAALIKQHFQLDNVSYRHASPVLIPPGKAIIFNCIFELEGRQREHTN